MPIASTGYKDNFTDVAWSRMTPFHRFGRFAVQSPADLRVVADTATTRGVIVRPGRAFGDGILDEVTGDTALAFPAPTAPTFGVIVMRRTWSTNTSVLMAIPAGTATMNDPGNVSDQILAVVVYNQTATLVTDIRDRRCWADDPNGISLQAARGQQAQFAAGTPGSFMSLSMQTPGGVLARAGQYSLTGIAAALGSVALEGNLTLQCTSDNALTVLGGIEVGVIPTAGHTLVIADTYNHLGGVLDVNLVGLFNGTGTVFALAGSRVKASWSAPALY